MQDCRTAGLRMALKTWLLLALNLCEPLSFIKTFPKIIKLAWLSVLFRGCQSSTESNPKSIVAIWRGTCKEMVLLDPNVLCLLAVELSYVILLAGSSWCIANSSDT